jgi:hypothetical protein
MMPVLLNEWLWIGAIVILVTIAVTYRLAGRRSR